MRRIVRRGDLDGSGLAGLGDYHVYLPVVKKVFDELERGLGGGPGFSLGDHGPIFLLGPEDDLRDLRSAHLSESLFDTVPEEVAEIRTAGETLYKLMILCNNDFMPVFLVPKSVMDAYPESPAYLERWS